MKRWLGSLVVALCVVAVGGATPGCSCNHNGAGNGDGGGGTGGTGGGFGDGGGNACGDNDPGCTTACLGPTCVPPSMFPLPGDMPPDPNVGADGVGRDPNGWIVLNQGNSSFNYLWIADDQSYWVGMVSKIDTRKSTAAGGAINHDYREVARYLTVTCESNEPASWLDHSGYVIGTASPTQLGTCNANGTGCCARTATGNARTPVQLYHNRPSRTAVDFNGDAWVANRAHDSYGSGDPADAGIHHQSSATKIANKNNSINDTDCIDRNHNGKIDTSYDADGDGIINTDCNADGIPDSLGNVTAAKPCVGTTKQEFFGLDDECILFTTNTGAEGGTGRPLALGQGATDFAPSDAWAGRFTDAVFYRIDGTTGLIKGNVQLKSGATVANPYGAAIDQTGILWAPDLGDHTLWYADTNNTANVAMVTPPGTVGGTGFYGIAIDGYKQALMTGGQPQLMQDIWVATLSAPHVVRYTPMRTGGFGSLGLGKWTDFTWTGAAGNGRGVGVDNRSPTSFAWTALDGSNALGQVAVNANFVVPDGTPTLQTITLPMSQLNSTVTGSTTLGAGVAADLDIWGVNQGNIAGAAPGNATHFHVDMNGVVTPPTAADQVRLDDNGITPGAPAHREPYPYTYSDFTGFGLKNFTNPHGSYSYIWTGCGVGKTKWIGVTWDAATPPGTAISMKARSSDDKSTFSTATYTGNYTSSPADLRNAAPSGGGPLAPNPSGFLQVEFDLTTTDQKSTPALKSYTVIWECVNGIG